MNIMLNAPEWYIELVTSEHFYTMKVIAIICIIIIIIHITNKIIAIRDTNEILINQNEEIIDNLETIEKQLFIMNDNMKNKDKNTSTEIYKENTNNTNRTSR